MAFFRYKRHILEVDFLFNQAYYFLSEFLEFSGGINPLYDNEAYYRHSISFCLLNSEEVSMRDSVPCPSPGLPTRGKVPDFEYA